MNPEPWTWKRVLAQAIPMALVMIYAVVNILLGAK
jgi:hypothetical protein